jgi:hypothetical protein
MVAYDRAVHWNRVRFLLFLQDGEVRSRYVQSEEELDGNGLVVEFFYVVSYIGVPKDTKVVQVREVRPGFFRGIAWSRGQVVLSLLAEHVRGSNKTDGVGLKRFVQSYFDGRAREQWRPEEMISDPVELRKLREWLAVEARVVPGEEPFVYSLRTEGSSGDELYWEVCRDMESLAGTTVESQQDWLGMAESRLGPM